MKLSKVRTAPFTIACLCLITSLQCSCQTFTVIYNFTGGSDGAYLFAAPIISNNTLYGTASMGGTFDEGSVFAVNTDGTGFTNLHSFTDPSGGPPYPNEDGYFPCAAVILSSNILFGTTQNGGTYGLGALFAVNINGSGFTNFHNFNVDDGPIAGLLLSGNTLYGTTLEGGGAVFAINTDGSGFSNVYAFSGGNDGGDPGGVILSGNTLFGTTTYGGSNHNGTVFCVNTNGSGFSNLYSFTTGFTNGDGAQPQSSLVLCGNTLYGTAYKGGLGGNGTVFAINTDGTGFTNLHSFAGPPGNIFVATNSEGEYPYAGLVLSGNTLYGTTLKGGVYGAGAIFALNTDGTGFTNLHIFAGRISQPSGDGYEPYGGLALSGNTLYGTTYEGGTLDYGTVFSLSFAPQLAISTSSTKVVLTWPTNVAGFDYTGYTLESTTNLVSPSWSAVSPSPVVVNGQETVTNAISGTQMFYRLTE